MKPVLLLIPGMSNTPAVFDRILPGLSEAALCRTTDVRTTGSIASMAARAWQELADVEPSRPLLVAGFSMGGYIALQMLATAPRRIDGLAMIASSALPERTDALPVRERAMAAATRDWDKYCERITEFLIGESTRAAPELRAAIVADLRASGPETTVAQLRAVSGRADHRALLSGLACETLIIAAADDPLIPLGDARATAACIPGARLEVIADAGHLLPWEQPARLGAELAGWIGRCTARAAG